jgi:uncharacterized cysteine cluster protein YcgN (CxxCxxCC family)
VTECNGCGGCCHPFTLPIGPGQLWGPEGNRVACDNYDEETRRCTDYENRPDICRRYPWFNGVPVPGAQLPPTCSFRADIGLPVEDVPVQVARSGARERNRKKGSGIS